MVEFFWKFVALSLLLLRGDDALKHVIYGRTYGTGWRKVASHVWHRRKDIRTVKPSGTVSRLSGVGIEPSFGDRPRVPTAPAHFDMSYRPGDGA